MKKYTFSILILLILFTGCEEYLDVNTDPNSPTEPAIDQLLPSIMYDMADDMSIRTEALGYITAVFTHQISTREEYDQYGVLGSTYGIQTYWQDLYAGPLMDLRVLIELAEETDNMQYAGIAKLLKAYTYSVIVDLWADVPYSEATQPGIIEPVFDDDRQIYTSLFELIDEAKTDLQNEESENIRTPGSDDLIYGGDMNSWIRMANTLKLKMYNQARKTDMFNQSEVSNLLSGELIDNNTHFMLQFGTSSAPENRHPAFVDEYVGAQISSYISPWFFETLSGLNQQIFNGIRDPRIPYYWCNQLTEEDEPENNPEYKNGNFVSIYFGSLGINRDHAGRSTFSMMGIYPCGGKYDDGTGGGSLGSDDGTGAVPHRFITYADRLFIEAELRQVGLADGSAREKLEEAIIAAFEQVDMVVALSGTSQNVPVLSGSDNVNSYISSIMNLYDAASAERQLEIILTQKWISGFGANIDLYADYRRTGYPVMFDPNSNNGFQNGGPDGSGPVPTQTNRGYPLSLPYDDDEITLNNNAPDQKIIPNANVFWDVE